MKLSRDLGFGFRLLRKRPGFTVAGARARSRDRRHHHHFQRRRCASVAAPALLRATRRIELRAESRWKHAGGREPIRRRRAAGAISVPGNSPRRPQRRHPPRASARAPRLPGVLCMAQSRRLARHQHPRQLRGTTGPGHVRHYLIDFSSTLGSGSDTRRRIAPQDPRGGTSTSST